MPSIALHRQRFSMSAATSSGRGCGRMAFAKLCSLPPTAMEKDRKSNFQRPFVIPFDRGRVLFGGCKLANCREVQILLAQLLSPRCTVSAS